MTDKQFAEYLEGRAYGHKQQGKEFDSSDLARQFVPYFQGNGNARQRIEVTRTYTNGETYTRRGTVGITSGWRPTFILMHRISDHGSSDVLSSDDKVVCVIPSKRR